MLEWIDPRLSVGGLIAGIIVGLTGMGGAALVTPMLLLFGVPATSAVSSDVVASAIMKPVGSYVHVRARTVHWRLVWWLSAGSVPGVLVGTWIFSRVAQQGGTAAEATVKVWIGMVLLIAVATMGVRALITARSTRRTGVIDLVGTETPVRIAPTVILGALVGLLVGLTSVGSGSLVVTTLLLLYPMLQPKILVGTDITQAVPMLVAGAIAHAGIGDVAWGLTASLLIGQIPGVWMGARLSSRYDGHALRWLLMVILVSTGLRLLGVNGLACAIIAILGAAVVGTIMVRQRLASRAAAAASD